MTELLKIMSNQNVLYDESLLEMYSGDSSFAPRRRPKSVVKVNTTAEVQALVQWANETATPLVPVSSGVPHFRGDTVPSTGGALIVDLSGMKKVYIIDRRNRVVMIEPGVTFEELMPQLHREGIRLNMPLLPRANKSVIGSMLEREPVIMPVYQWDAQDPLTCIEVIFGTGELFRTGSAAGPGTLEEQWEVRQAQVNPCGPGQTDLARVVQGSQGTMGIVTWSSVRCELAPSLQKPFMAGADSLETLIDFIYYLLWLKSVDECLLLNNVDLALAMAKSSEEYNNLKSKLPRWIFFFCISGFEYLPEKRVAYREKAMYEAARKYGVNVSDNLGNISAVDLLKTLTRPSTVPYWKHAFEKASQDICFLTTMDKTPKFIEVMDTLMKNSGSPLSETGVYIQPMVQGTSCHCEFTLFYNPNNVREVAKVKEFYNQSAEALLKADAFFSRPYGILADLAYRKDAETTAALKKVKQIFDPNNIMNPGKLCF